MARIRYSGPTSTAAASKTSSPAPTDWRTHIGIALGRGQRQDVLDGSGVRYKIQRSNLDGSGVEDPRHPRSTDWRYLLGSLALDVASGKMYWTDNGARIRYSGPTSTAAASKTSSPAPTDWNILTRHRAGRGQRQDVLDGLRGTDKIQRSNLDGSGVEDLVTRADGLETPDDIALGLTPAEAGKDLVVRASVER